MNAFVLFHTLIFRSKTNKTVGDQINTVSKTSTEHGEVNLQMKTRAYEHRRVDRIELKVWCGLFIYYSFISPNFSKDGGHLFVHTH